MRGNLEDSELSDVLVVVNVDSFEIFPLIVSKLRIHERIFKKTLDVSGVRRVDNDIHFKQNQLNVFFSKRVVEKFHKAYNFTEANNKFRRYFVSSFVNSLAESIEEVFDCIVRVDIEFLQFMIHPRREVGQQNLIDCKCRVVN
ncbi:Hypothetical_protein [Hexamita inflata]|uniref:Hypothetical_protein n=1 Tax=Hexamita inflata TaxID=28002 RepID=A0AA86RJA2_9EUKA|nr:Hypothetical protein HINF_LOCUS60804 [Hexamita inflata]